MSEGDKLQKAVSFTISSGYQLDNEAFKFLNSLAKDEDPLNVMETVIDRVKKLPQKPLFINRTFIESMKKEFCIKEKTLFINRTFIESMKKEFFL